MLEDIGDHFSWICLNVMSQEGKLRNKYVVLVKLVFHIKGWLLVAPHRIFMEHSSCFIDLYFLSNIGNISKCELDTLVRQHSWCCRTVPSCYTDRFEADRWLLFCTFSLSLAGRGVKVRMPAHCLMWCPVTGWDLVGRHVPHCPRHKLLPVALPIPLAHHWAKISLCRLSDARPRTQPQNEGRPLANRWCVTKVSLVLSHRDKSIGGGVANKVIGGECGWGGSLFGTGVGALIPLFNLVLTSNQ